MALTFFSGKISGVFTLALQGISKVVGLITKAIVEVVDQVMEVVSSISTPLTEKLTGLPLLGEVVDTVLETSTGLIEGVSSGLHAVSDQLIEGDLLGGVNTALNGTTSLVGQTLSGVSDIVDRVLDATAPVTAFTNDLPVLGNLVGAVGSTLGNVSGLIDETGDYVASIQPLELVTDLLNNPVATLGGVVQDVSGTVDALLDDISPLSGALTELPAVGDVVELAGNTLNAVNQGLYDVATHLTQVPPLNLSLDLPLSYA